MIAKHFSFSKILNVLSQKIIIAYTDRISKAVHQKVFHKLVWCHQFLLECKQYFTQCCHKMVFSVLRILHQKDIILKFLFNFCLLSYSVTYRHLLKAWTKSDRFPRLLYEAVDLNVFKSHSNLFTNKNKTHLVLPNLSWRNWIFWEVFCVTMLSKLTYKILVTCVTYVFPSCHSCSNGFHPSVRQIYTSFLWHLGKQKI